MTLAATTKITAIPMAMGNTIVRADRSADITGRITITRFMP